MEVAQHTLPEYDLEESEYTEVEEEYEEWVLEEEEVEEYVPPTSGLAAQLAAAAQNREQRVESGTSSLLQPQEEVGEDEDDYGGPPPGGGMAAMIAAAASKRTVRIESGDGELQLREHQPETAAPPPKGGMAAMVAAAAGERTGRLDAGGEVQIREIPEAHRSVFVTVVDEAAKIGNLTKLKEKYVEAIVPVREEVVDTWVPSGLRSDHQRSDFFMVVNEAAALGQMKRKKPHHVVTNYDTAVIQEEEVVNVDNVVDEKGRRMTRRGLLLDVHLKEHQKEKGKDWAPENHVKAYRSIDEVELPSREPPKWRPNQSKKTGRDLMDAISQGVAEKSWERRYRLDRPHAELKVTRRCDCKFCEHPNPFQTHKYKKIERGELVLPPEHVPEPEKPIPVVQNPDVVATATATATTTATPSHSSPPTQPNASAWIPPKRTAPPAVFQNANIKKFDPKKAKEKALALETNVKTQLAPEPPQTPEPVENTKEKKEKKTDKQKRRRKREKKKRKKKKAQKDDPAGCGCAIM